MEKLLRVTFVSVVMLPALLYSAIGADISGYTSSSDYCDGLAIACADIAQGSCCDFQGLPINFVRWTGIGITNLAVEYSGGGCNTVLSFGCGLNNRCLRGSGATGAKWVQGCSMPSSSCNSTASTCSSAVVPTSVQFTDSSSKRLYVLNSTDALHVFTQIDKLPTDADKIHALLLQGASNSTA